MDSYTLLEKLCNIPGAPGFEDQVRESIAALVTPLVDEVHTDALGNLLVTRRGRTDFKMMLDAHMDEIGFMVQHIDERGFIRFTPLGSWDARLLPSHAPTIYTREGRSFQGVIGTAPPHILKPAERETVISMEDMFIDIGATSSQEVGELGVRVGDPIVIQYPFRRIGQDTVIGKALDDRIGCALIIKTLEALHEAEIDATIVGAFVVSEERGMIGARTAAFQIEPDLAIALEAGVAADIPGVAEPRQPTGLDKGPALTVADNSFIVPRNMVRALERMAEHEGIQYQIKLPGTGGTDAGAIHQVRGGVFTGVLSVPCRYIHSPFSMCRLSEFDATSRLLTAFCRAAPIDG
ncbi:MAG: M42 family metallopeptidase [Chloroflexi bacterium]|nr:M42 family metallopeptidase [Chloroflexota bacterium]